MDADAFKTKTISKHIQDKILEYIHPNVIQYPWDKTSIIFPDEVEDMTINPGQTDRNEGAESFQVNTYRNLKAVKIQETNFSTTICYGISSKKSTMQLL